MKKYYLIFLMFVISFSGYCQNDSYYPLTQNTSNNYGYFNSFLKRSYNGPINIKSKSYIKESISYPDGGVSDTLIRVSHDTVYVYSESKKHEIVYFGIRPVKGEKIGFGTITNINASLKTPIKKYKGLLEIEMNIPPNEVWKKGLRYTMYLKKGVGLVAIRRSMLQDYLIE